MGARLVAEEGDLKGLTFSLEQGDSWVIGRDPDECQLVIEDPLASRKHLIARRTPQGISIENLSSTNPVQINEEEIKGQPRLLQQGDTIRIGNEIFRFYTDTSARVVDDTSPQEEIQEDTPPFQENPIQNYPSNSALIPQHQLDEQDDNRQDTIFDEENDEEISLAEINFGIAETGRWLLKVVGGPNNGAEFYMQASHTYILGTDPHSCDIVFHDTSVSRQHARITVTPDDILFIEDLKSRNGVLISSQSIEGKQQLFPSNIVTLGTTSFVVYDREGEMQTIISPLLPSIVKVLQTEETSPVKEVLEPIVVPEKIRPEAAFLKEPPKVKQHWGPVILLSILLGLFAIAGLGTVSLFKSEPIVSTIQENAEELIQQALAPFPAVKHSYNKSTGGLLLLGHVATAMDKNQLLYNLEGLKFIKYIDDKGIIIDEYVWQEINSILARNPAWRGITVHSPAAGQFILSGYLQTRNQSEELSDYMSVNFSYLDLLKKQVVVEEDVISQINAWLQQFNLRDLTAKMTNGEVILSGNLPSDKQNELNQIIAKIKGIPGVRGMTNLVKIQAPELGIINLTGQYEVTGQSKLGTHYTVVINGRILSEGDAIDGMVITSIKPNMVLLEKDGTKYRIDYQ